MEVSAAPGAEVRIAPEPGHSATLSWHRTNLRTILATGCAVIAITATAVANDAANGVVASSDSTMGCDAAKTCRVDATRTTDQAALDIALMRHRQYWRNGTTRRTPVPQRASRELPAYGRSGARRRRSLVPGASCSMRARVSSWPRSTTKSLPPADQNGWVSPIEMPCASGEDPLEGRWDRGDTSQM